MKEMFYQQTRGVFVLDKGINNGYKYAIISYGTHPCCYVFLPKGHKYYGKNYDDIDIDCHYGLTFSEDDLPYNPLQNDDWIIGWDYAHCGDYYGIYEMKELKKFDNSKDKKWTTKELQQEVFDVIKQL